MSNIIITKSDIKKFVRLFRAGLVSKEDKSMNIYTAEQNSRDAYIINHYGEAEINSEDKNDKPEPRIYVELTFKFSISTKHADKIKDLDASDIEIEEATKKLTEL